MANVSELPELISESIDLTKQYLRQETVEPAKRLGKVAGFGFAASALFGVAALLGGIAVNRWIIKALPDGRAWSGLGYVISAVALVLIGAIIIGLGRRGYEDPGGVRDALPELRDQLKE